MTPQHDGWKDAAGGRSQRKQINKQSDLENPAEAFIPSQSPITARRRGFCRPRWSLLSDTLGNAQL